MNKKELIKNYWFIGLIALGMIVYFVAYSVNSYKSRPIYVDGKTQDGQSVVFSIDGENYFADDFYETLYGNMGTSSAYKKWSNAVIDKAIETDEEISNYASNYASYISYYNDTDTIDSSLKAAGYVNGSGDLQQYCIDMVKSDRLYAEFYKDNFDTYAPSVIESAKPRKVSHILIKVENVNETTDENGNTVYVAEMSDEEKTKLDNCLNDLKTKDWSEVCATYSDDSTKDSAGYLGIYDEYLAEQASFVEEFTNAFLAMDLNTVSEPVLSQFGYHIIKVEEVSMDELKESDSFINEIGSNYNYASVKAVYLKAQELGFEIIDEDLKNLIDEYLTHAEEEIAPATVEEVEVSE